jgi:hypothetical protein
MCEKPAFPGLLRAGCVAWPNAGLPGWGGRDRTSEWRNQNPLPYRLATPQQAFFRSGGRTRRRTPFRHRRSIERGEPFQPAKGTNFRLNWAKGFPSLYWGCFCAVGPAGPAPKYRLSPPNPRVESRRVSWEDGTPFLISCE